MIRNQINQNELFNVETEVTKVWQYLLDNYTKLTEQNKAISFLQSNIEKKKATFVELNLEYEITLQKRIKIKEELESNPSRRFAYMAMLMNYIHTKVFDSRAGHVVLIVDNVDQEPSETQQDVRQLMKKFAYISKIRVVITARPATYFQQYAEDGLSDPIDIVPYCGPEHTLVIEHKLMMFIKSSDKSLESILPEKRKQLVAGVNDLLTKELLRAPIIEKHCSALCGRSVRRGLILAQHLIDNSVYDPAKSMENKEIGIILTVSDLLRALFISTDDHFIWTEEGLIDNIFQVHSNPTAGHFIKLRILKAIKNSLDGNLKVGKLVQILMGFDYSCEIICETLNEMKHPRKSIIWSDSVKEEFDRITKYAHTHISMTTSGEGYENYLFNSLSYIQEMLPDTIVNENHFSSDYHFGRTEDRLNLVFQFINYLKTIEKKEYLTFISSNGKKDYISAFGNAEFFTKIMAENVRAEISVLIRDKLKHSADKQKKSLQEFHADIDSKLTSIVNDLNEITKIIEADLD